MKYYSQFGEDELALKLLNNITDGKFIEVGAFDGIYYSVTYALEKLGWTGWLVEPIKEKAILCAFNRKSSNVTWTALGSSADTHVKFKITEDVYGGMLSSSGEINKILLYEEVEVPSTTLNSILNEYKGPIDLVVLDVEGSEMDVLKGFDLKLYKPRLLLIEDNALIAGFGSKELINHMLDNDYCHCGYFAINHIFVRNDCKDILNRVDEMNNCRTCN